MIIKRRTPVTDTLLVAFASITYSIVKGASLVTGVYFIEFQNHLNASARAASLAVGLATATNFLGGPLYGYLYSVFGFKRACIAASLLTAVGFMLVSVLKTIETVQLFMAIFIGVGVGLTHISTLSLIGRAFTARRSLANSIVSAGTMGSALFMGPLVQDLIETYSWRWSLLILGAIVLNSVPMTMLSDWFFIPETSSFKNNEKEGHSADIEMSVLEGSQGDDGDDVTVRTKQITNYKLCSKERLDFSVLLDPCFVSYLVSMSGAAMAVACPSFYLMRYAQDAGIGDTDAVWLLSICRALFLASCPLVGLASSYCGGGIDVDNNSEENGRSGRTPILNFGSMWSINGLASMLVIDSDISNEEASGGRSYQQLLQKLHLSYVLVFMELFMAVSLAIPLMSESYYGFLAYAIFGGMSTGPIAALAVTVLADLFGAERLPSTLGFRSLAAGIAVLATPPFIGHLVDVYGNFKPAQYVCSALSVLSAVLTLTTQLIMNRRRKNNG